jgi:succinyl-CoA synthetase beta subunit
MERPPTRLDEIAWQIEDDDYRGTGYFTQMFPDLEGKGWLGFHGIGGGGAMLAASAFTARGFKIADYADTSGDPTGSKIYLVMKCIFSLPIDGYVLMGSCLANQEQWHHAHAIVKVLREEETGISRRPPSGWKQRGRGSRNHQKRTEGDDASMGALWKGLHL